MTLLIQTEYSADPLPLKSKLLPRAAMASRASVLFFISLLLLVSTPDMALSYSQGDLYRQAKASTVLIVGINDESNALSFGIGATGAWTRCITSTRGVSWVSPQCLDERATHVQ